MYFWKVRTRDKCRTTWRKQEGKKITQGTTMQGVVPLH